MPAGKPPKVQALFESYYSFLALSPTNHELATGMEASNSGRQWHTPRGRVANLVAQTLKGAGYLKTPVLGNMVAVI